MPKKLCVITHDALDFHRYILRANCIRAFREQWSSVCPKALSGFRRPTDFGVRPWCCSPHFPLAGIKIGSDSAAETLVGFAGVGRVRSGERLERIEATLHTLIAQKTVKEYYSTAEVAQILGRAEFTVREWCRLGRIWASKRDCGRGNSKEWIISHEELTRIQNEGLLPL